MGPCPLRVSGAEAYQPLLDDGMYWAVHLYLLKKTIKLLSSTLDCNEINNVCHKNNISHSVQCQCKRGVVEYIKKKMLCTEQLNFITGECVIEIDHW